MHCPNNLSGFEYVELVAAVSIILAKDKSALDIFILSEFLNSVSNQLLTLAAFRQVEEDRLKKSKENGKNNINIAIF